MPLKMTRKFGPSRKKKQKKQRGNYRTDEFVNSSSEKKGGDGEGKCRIGQQGGVHDQESLKLCAASKCGDRALGVQVDFCLVTGSVVIEPSGLLALGLRPRVDWSGRDERELDQHRGKRGVSAERVRKKELERWQARIVSAF